MCTQFRRHMRITHKVPTLNTSFLIQCQWCEKKVSTQYFHQHAIREHDYGQFWCEKCPFSAYSAKDLIAHIEEGHKEDQFARCPSCKKEVLLTHMEIHYRSCILSKLRLKGKCKKLCAKCGKTLPNRKAFKEHVQSAHENINFGCLLCQLTFNKETQLKRHNIIVHSTDKRYQCKVCGVRQGCESNLRRHERIHFDSRFQCSFCPKKLSSQYTLTAHERLCSGEKPFKCSICSAAFASQHGLAAHTKGVHKIAGPRGGKTGWNNHKKK